MSGRVSRFAGVRGRYSWVFFLERRGQEGHLSLAARWPSAKAEEEPRSLQRVTGTEERAGTHTPAYTCT